MESSSGMVSLGCRVPASLKARLDRAAELAGHTQSEEAARRLADSFELQPIFEIMTLGQSADGRPWFEDPARAVMVLQMVRAYLQTFVSTAAMSPAAVAAVRPAAAPGVSSLPDRPPRPVRLKRRPR